MMYITTKTKDITWHVGEFFDIPTREVDNVICVQADGDELDLILRTMKNLPTSHRHVVRWFGDHAKFIAANLL